MSTKYSKGADVPTETLIKRLSELSVACGSKELMEREFTRRIPAELDRDADLVLSIAADRIAELEKQLKPRLFWDADNTETSYDSVCELMQAKFDDGLAVGDVVEIQRAALLPNETYVLTKIKGDYDFEYEQQVKESKEE